MPVTDYAVSPTLMTATHDAVMPQDAEAEASILSAMMVSPDALSVCLVDLNENDFYLPSNRKIYVAMREMFDRNMPVDTISLADYLKSQGELERVGGRTYLLDLAANPLSLVGWRRHAQMLRRDATLRRMITASAQITALAYDAPEDTKEVIDKAEELLLSATGDAVKSNYQPLDKIMLDFYEELSAQCENPSQLLGVETGFSTLDSKLLGLRPGQMVVVGARPGVGKTSLALNIALNAASRGATVAFFSLEMSKVEIAQRLLSSQSHIDLTTIRAGRIRKDQWGEVIQATSDLSNLDVLIDDTPDTTVTEIRAKARRMLDSRLKEGKLCLVIIDYLQLLSPPPGGRRSDSRANEVSEMSRGIKIMAKDLGVPVMALSQLNRDVESRSGGRGPAKKSKRPQLSDLRESGSIEQDADIVLLLDRSTTDEEAAREDRPDPGITDLIIAKNRSGQTGVVSLTFLASSTKFVEVVNNYDD